jgi:DNA-binding YbaB/EbfC family protein
MSGFNLQELMSQAKQQYETLQKKMEQTIVESSSGGGTVTVKMDGRKQVLAIKIDPEAVDETMQSSVGGMLGGLGLGGL